MRRARMTFLAALAMSLVAATSGAQAIVPDPTEAPAQAVAYTYDDYLSFNAPAAPLPAQPKRSEPAAPTCPADGCVSSGCASGDCGGCGRAGCGACCAGQAWKLPQPCALQCLGFTVGGWVQQGITLNGQWPTDRFNGPLATNDRANEYQLNQTWIFLERKVNTGGCGLDWGGRVDACYGTDWRFGKCYGLEDRINSADHLYGLVLPQFYGELGYNNLTVKGGHYAVGFGYEMIPAVGNFFYSHSYALSYCQPLLVTGLEADYRLNDQWTLIGGFNRGWMMFEDMDDNLDFLGGIKWTSPDKTSTLSFMMDQGVQQDPWGPHDRLAYVIVYTEQLTQKLRYVIESDLGEGKDANPRTGEDAFWYDLCQYLIYQINPCWSAALRVEWLRDAGGSRVAGVGRWIGSDAGWDGNWGFDGDFYEISAGLNWRPHPNFVLRPEIRWDWYRGSTNLDGEYPFDDGTRRDQFTVATDLIVTF